MIFNSQNFKNVSSKLFPSYFIYLLGNKNLDSFNTHFKSITKPFIYLKNLTTSRQATQTLQKSFFFLITHNKIRQIVQQFILWHVLYFHITKEKIALGSFTYDVHSLAWQGDQDFMTALTFFSRFRSEFNHKSKERQVTKSFNYYGRHK